nr:MAG TPA: hypothetical protein [Caudoviricetes sp.]
MEFVIVTLITALVGLFAGGLYRWVVDYAESFRRNYDIKRENAYSHMVQIVDTAKVKGKYSHYEIERFDQLQKEYKHLGGNGASDRLRAELELLPMED